MAESADNEAPAGNNFYHAQGLHRFASMAPLPYIRSSPLRYSHPLLNAVTLSSTLYIRPLRYAAFASGP